MPGGLHWTLVFTPASLDHLAERNIDAADVDDAVYGQHGAVRVRRAGRGAGQRWFVIAPMESGELLTCVFRPVLARDLKTSGAFVVSDGEQDDAPARIDSSMRLCVSARVSDQDEIRSYRRWRERKGGQ